MAIELSTISLNLAGQETSFAFNKKLDILMLNGKPTPISIDKGQTMLLQCGHKVTREEIFLMIDLKLARAN